MRICFLSQEDIVRPQGGTGTYVRNVTIALAARGHDIHAIVRQRDGQPAFERVDGVAVHRVPAPGPPVLYSPLYFRQARHMFLGLHRGTPFDLIQGNLPLMSTWGLRDSGLPPIVETVHCTVQQQLRGLAHTARRDLNLNEVLTQALAPIVYRRERYLTERADTVIAVSEGLRRELVERSGYGAEKVVVIPNGVDYPRFARVGAPERDATRQALEISADERVIMYLGRLMEGKRVADLIRALPIVLRRIPNARLVIVGRRNRNAERLAATARVLGMERHVTLVDHIPYHEVPAYYAMADVYALPSAHEGFPFTVLEAMAAGTPVVASAIPGIDEQIVPYETGLLHPVGNVSEIARQLTRVLEDRPLARQLTEAARRVVEQQYNWEVIGAETEALFECVLADRAAAPDKVTR